MMHEWPACGRIGPMGHELAWRVYYADTDSGGVVYHANYLAIAERARGEMLRTAGYEPAPLSAANGRAFAVRACHIDFLAPARLGDILTIVSQIKALGGASLEMAQKIRANGQDLVTILVRLVCIDGQFKPARVPEELRCALQRHPTLMMAAPTLSTGKDKA